MIEHTFLCYAQQAKENILNNVESLLNDNPTKKIYNDTPEPWGLFFQDNATPQMEGLEELHNNIMFYLAIILFAVSWIMLSIILNLIKQKYLINIQITEL